MSEREPWEQQASEPPLAFSAFAMFRDQGPGRRQLKGLKDANGTAFSYHSLRNWHNIYHWRERCARWDAEMDKQARERLLFERQVTALRHFDLTARMLDILDAKIATMNTPEQIAAMNPRDVKDWLAIAVQTQRLSMDMATHINESREGEAQDATAAVRDLLKRPDAVQMAAQLGDMLLNEHPRSEPVQSRTTGTHLHLVESVEPRDEAE
jgi:hypothetical protein